jgi:DNA-binding NarL/FixJ family response regulator
MGEETEAPEPSRSTQPSLTDRECEVASLVADGLSNREVASALVISQRTAKSHIDHILSKLGSPLGRRSRRGSRR